MTKNRQNWDEERCVKIIKVVSQFPDNLRAGFEECAKKFGGSAHYYKVAWYHPRSKLCKFRKNSNSLICASLSMASVNYKNSPRVNGKFRPERAERVVSATAEFFKGWWANCTKFLE